MRSEPAAQEDCMLCHRLYTKLRHSLVATAYLALVSGDACVGPFEHTNGKSKLLPQLTKSTLNTPEAPKAPQNPETPPSPKDPWAHSCEAEAMKLQHGST